MAQAGNAASTPVIPGFFPDPTVCQVGADYYLASSSFEYFPGVPIFHSTDLLTWVQIGNVLTTRQQCVEGDARPSGGIWAGTLRHHDGVFYYITTNIADFDAGQIIVTADHPAGPWSAPVHVRDAIGIDPDIAWDDDGTCIVTWHKFDFALGGQAVVQARVDTATGELLAPAYEVWQGSGLPAAEGPHLYKIGDRWYLMLAEGGTEKGHCVTVARAPRPEGPYEGCPVNPIMTRRSTFTPAQSTGHADLVRTPDGGWAAVYLGNRPQGPTPAYHLLGRETFLAGIDWVDDWPVFAPDRFEVPPIDTSFDDSFETEAFSPRWVVASGDIADVLRPKEGGVVVPLGQVLCTRVRDLRWTASATLREGTFSLRMDSRHAYGITVRGGRAVAWARVGGLVAEVGSCDIGEGPARTALAAVDPDGAFVPRGDAGPDLIVIAVEVADSMVELARLDGRYVSTEVAAGFTGRVLGIGDPEEDTAALRVSYNPA